MYYRVNAESIPKDHWIYDVKEGRSRFVSELCHFVDYCRFIAGSEIVDSSFRTIHTEALSSNELLENLVMTLSFKDGSVATILYNTIGDASSSKEFVEIIGERSSVKLTDFKQLVLTNKGHNKTSKYYLKTEKGHKEELEFFINSIQQGDTKSSFFDESIEVTKVTLKEL
jgi:predicted dehydrogenase